MRVLLRCTVASALLDPPPPARGTQKPGERSSLGWSSGEEEEMRTAGSDGGGEGGGEGSGAGGDHIAASAERMQTELDAALAAIRSAGGCAGSEGGQEWGERGGSAGASRAGGGVESVGRGDVGAGGGYVSGDAEVAPAEGGAVPLVRHRVAWLAAGLCCLLVCAACWFVLLAGLCCLQIPKPYT